MTTNNPLGSQLMRATLARFESQRESALATIGLYLNAAAGVGDHPDVVETIDNLIGEIAEFDDKLMAIDEHFNKVTPRI